MFDDYAKKLEELGADVPKTFETVAKKGAIHFENAAKEITDKERLVDTGAYRRNWNGEYFKPDEKSYAIACQNTMEYASYLEDGYNIKTAHFVPFKADSGVSRTGKAWKTKGMQGTPKTKAFIASFKAKYPDAKGFLAKPRTFKGLKIGKRAITNTELWLTNQLDEEIEKLMKQK